MVLNLIEMLCCVYASPWQDTSRLMTQQDLRQYPTKPWGIPISPERWLQHELDEDDRERLTALGNIVMPACANFAAHALSRAMVEA